MRHPPMDQTTSSNVYDFPARAYGIQGRWPSPDPAGLAAVSPAFPQSGNRYAYVTNNPLSFNDPTGQKQQPLPVYVTSHSHCDPDLQVTCVDSSGLTENGYDIFDAIAGAPGTYVTHDAFGRLGFGFSEDLYFTTLNFIDSGTSLLANTSVSVRNGNGFQVYVQNYGYDGRVSGFVPDFVSAQMQGLQDAGLRPSAPQTFSEALAFEHRLIRDGGDPDLARMVMLMAYPEVFLYGQALTDWYGAYTAPIQQVFAKYPGIIH